MTTFAELMTEHDKCTLENMMGYSCGRRVQIVNLYLKEFLKEAQFTEKIKYATHHVIYSLTVNKHSDTYSGNVPSRK